MSKIAICTMVVGDFYKMIWDISGPTIKDYATKIDADLEIMTEVPGAKTACEISYARLGFIRKLFKKYDRILWVDADVLIRFDAPNIFKVVPEDSFGVFNEGIVHPRYQSKIDWGKQTGVPDREWCEDRDYYNVGVMVASKMHESLFVEPSKMIDNFYEQTLLNWRLYERKIKIHSLDYKFNRINGVTPITGEEFHDAYFIHFAGAFSKYSPVEENVEGFKFYAKEIAKFKELGVVPYLPKKIFLQTAGALGDVVATEPVVRYVKNVMHGLDDVVVETAYPEVFDHLAQPGFTVIKCGNTMKDTGYLRLHLHPETTMLSFNQIHPVDFAAVMGLKGQLPKGERNVMLDGSAYIPDHQEKIQRSVLVHPGKSWQSKTFPKFYWDEVIRQLLVHHLEVVVIGKDLRDDKGTVDVNTQGCLDLRNKLSLLQLFSAIRQSPLTISNDSAPVHIAGAFDNYCIMLCSAKHPDYIFPERNPELNIAMGTSIQRGLIVGKVHDICMDTCTEDALMACLPQPVDVARQAVKIMAGKGKIPMVRGKAKS